MGAQDSRTVLIDGTWRNDAGSELKLSQSGVSLSGVYRTKVGAAELGKDYHLVGWRDRCCVGFTVSWGPDIESLTSWAGLIEFAPDGHLTLSTMWILVSATTMKRDGEGVAVVDSASWEAFRTQSALFRRVSEA